MINELEGSLKGQGLRVGLVVSRFNHLVTSRLLDGCKEGLLRHRVSEDDITVAWVPGAFEIPLAAKRMAQSGRYDAVVCLGAVIRGDTPHFEYVAGQAAQGIARVALKSEVPVAFGVLTTDTMEQALERAGGNEGNKGYEAAVGAIQMANLLRSLG